MKHFLLLSSLCISLFATAQEKFTVYFDFDIDKANSPSVLSLSQWIAAHKDAEVLKIYGYADNIGNALYNIDLSERRATHVYEKLLEGNITMQNAEKKGFGESEAVSANRAEDRKVVVYFKQKPIVAEEVPKPVSELSKKITEAKKGDKIKVPNLHFLNNSPQVLPESRPVLYELLDIMKNNPKLKIDIQGHICCQKKEENQISHKRALTVYSFLIKNGIDKNRLSYQSFGSSHPIYPLPEKSEAEKVANRRVEIEIVAN